MIETETITCWEVITIGNGGYMQVLHQHVILELKEVEYHPEFEVLNTMFEITPTGSSQLFDDFRKLYKQFIEWERETCTDNGWKDVQSIIQKIEDENPEKII